MLPIINTLNFPSNRAENPDPDPSDGAHRDGREHQAHQVGLGRGGEGPMLCLPEDARGEGSGEGRSCVFEDFRELPPQRHLPAEV